MTSLSLGVDDLPEYTACQRAGWFACFREDPSRPAPSGGVMATAAAPVHHPQRWPVYSSVGDPLTVCWRGGFRGRVCAMKPAIEIAPQP